MTVQITLSISEELYQQYVLLAQMIGRDAAELLAAKLETGDQVEVNGLSDSEILRLADSKMPAAQSQRLHELLELNGEGALDEMEQQELDALMEIYDNGNLLKAQGALEAVRRGLRERAS